MKWPAGPPGEPEIAPAPEAAVNDALPDLFLRGGGALAQDKAIGVEGGECTGWLSPVPKRPLDAAQKRRATRGL